MKLIEIYNILNDFSPFSTQSEWDNSGLLLGEHQNEIQKIYVCLDVDEDLIKQADENSLFITHHPLIFKGLKHISGNLYPQKIIAMMMRKNISLISMHTNFDLSHLNSYFVEQILGFKIKEKDEFLIYCDLNFTFKELLFYVKDKLKIDILRFCDAGNESIKRVAICTGSGGDLINKIQADCFLSGDFKYHQAFEAMHNKLNLIDLGHYESERYFGEIVARYLQNFSLEVIISVSKNPFQYFKEN